MVEFLLAEDNNSVDSEEQPEYFYFAYYFRWPKTSSCVKGSIHCEIFLSRHFMKYEILSWNTFTSVSKIHRVVRVSHQ